MDSDNKRFKIVNMGDKTSLSEQHKPIIRLKSQSGTEHVHYSVVYEGFPDEFQTIAEKELKETPESRKKGLQRLREFVKSQGKPPLKDELPLLAALRNCKYDLKKAESKIKKVLKVRHELKAQLRNLKMETIERIIDDTGFGLFPYRDRFGRSIINTRPDAIHEEKYYSLSELAVVGKAGILFQLSFPITTVAGFVYLGDCSAPSYHMYYNILKELRTAIEIAVSLPVRIARVEIVNENFVCRSFYNLCNTFLSKKLMSRITLHGTCFKQMHEMYGANFLPEEYGGNGGPITSKPYKQKLLNFIRDLMEE